MPFDLPPLPQGLLFANVDPAAVDPASALVGDVAIVTWIELGHLRVGRIALP